MKKSALKKIKVLIVDEMINMRHSLKVMLRHIGFKRIVEADDGVKAWEIVKVGDIDFIISGWVMPKMDGLELLRYLREDPRFRDIPFLMMTGEVSESRITQAAETEVDGYIIKPFEENTLESKVLRILEHKESPSMFEKNMNEGTKFMDVSDYPAAIEMFAKALELKPESARARLAIGEAFESSGDYEEAEKWFKEAISVNPQYIRGYERLGNLFVETDREKEAVESFELAGGISPNNARRQATLGKLHIKQGNTEKAEKAFSLAIQNDRDNAALRVEIGEAYLGSGQAVKAAEAFKGSLAIIEDSNVYNRLGIALRRQGKVREAIAEYLKAIDVAPEDEVLYFNLGRAYFENEDYSNSIVALRKALELDRDFAECEELLTQVLKQSGQYATS
ncbi:Chemotaxis regulator - transmits chemoreceptor signals to flagelllar motor components CheY [hydrothermal vent metagenome]|uniref:Chemotaxis regulator - transmits chemoreceptor signals to flagelllar motor components CheY n=1 Tax=hydrothermal vent metagenome TaxID=652676 RepID=A0A3B1BVF9_9ZZZZ